MYYFLAEAMANALVFRKLFISETIKPMQIKFDVHLDHVMKLLTDHMVYTKLGH